MRKSLVNIASLFVSVVANRIFPILLLPFLTRALGPEQFGHYVLASSFSYLLAQIVEWGFNYTGVRQVALARRNERELGMIIATIAVARAFIIACLFLVCVTASPWLRWVAPNSPLYWAAACYGLLYAFDFRFAFYGLQESRPFLVLSFFQYLASFAAIVAMVHGPDDIWLAFVIPSGFSVLSVIVSLSLLRRWVVLQKPDWRLAQREILSSAKVFLARNVFQSSNQLGVLILGLYVSPQMVGWFGVSERISRTLGQLILYPLQMGLTPMVLQNSHKDQRQAVRIHIAGLGIAMVAAACAGVGLFIFAPEVLALLLGSAPSEAVTALRLLSVYPLIFVCIHQGGIFWLYLLHWDNENLSILLGYTLMLILVFLVVARQGTLTGIVLSMIGAGFSLVLSYFFLFSYWHILPWQQPLGDALNHQRMPNEV